MKELPKDQENLAESFRSYLRKKNMSENTGDAYGRTIRQLLSIYPVPTESLLRKYRSLLIANYRPATINQRIYAVNHFLLFLEEEHPELYPDLASFRLHAGEGYGLREGGCLADIAPTLIELMGMEQPKEMTGKSLLVRK